MIPERNCKISFDENDELSLCAFGRDIYTMSERAQKKRLSARVPTSSKSIPVIKCGLPVSQQRLILVIALCLFKFCSSGINDLLIRI